MKPFIYICSLMRTGSTVVSESLTALPHSFIFREPRLGDGKFRVKPRDSALFAEHGIELDNLEKRWCETHSSSLIGAFKQDLLPRLTKVVAQVGVKEIRHDGFRHYVDEFPNLRVILTGRDPRDVFLSLHDRLSAGTTKWSGPFTPESLAGNLQRQFEKQSAIADSGGCLKVRYEDFCADARNSFVRIKSFVESDLPGIGMVGSFNASNPKRRKEYDMHGVQITAKRVNRWKSEKNPQLRDAACRMFDLMSRYCEFWGYEK